MPEKTKTRKEAIVRLNIVQCADICMFDNGKNYRSKLLNSYKTTAMQFMPERIAENEVKK